MFWTLFVSSGTPLKSPNVSFLAQGTTKATNGKVQSVDMIYPRSAVHQCLYYGSMYGEDVKVPTGDAVTAAQAQ